MLNTHYTQHNTQNNSFFRVPSHTASHSSPQHNSYAWSGMDSSTLYWNALASLLQDLSGAWGGLAGGQDYQAQQSYETPQDYQPAAQPESVKRPTRPQAAVQVHVHHHHHVKPEPKPKPRPKSFDELAFPGERRHTVVADRVFAQQGANALIFTGQN